VMLHVPRPLRLVIIARDKHHLELLGVLVHLPVQVAQDGREALARGAPVCLCGGRPYSASSMFFS
jgi:hypothetical protein